MWSFSFRLFIWRGVTTLPLKGGLPDLKRRVGHYSIIFLLEGRGGSASPLYNAIEMEGVSLFYHTLRRGAFLKGRRRVTS